MPDELPDFPLASWELPPDSTEPLVAPATMCWRGTLFGRETDWLVRLVADNNVLGELFVRAEDDLREGSWWFGLCLFGLGEAEETEADQLMVVEYEVKTGAKVPRWRRVHLQDDTGSWGLTVTENSGELHTAIDRRTSVHFKTEWPFDFALASSAQVHAELLRALNDENSELNFARHWLLSSLDEQLALMVKWTRGSEEELRAVMQLALRVLGPKFSPFSLQWRFRAESQDWFLGQRIGKSWWESMDFDETTILNVWQTAFQELFGLVWNTQLAERYVCVRIGQHDAVLGRFQVSVPVPTHHEQLEAARELHCWLDEREARNELDAATLARLRDTLR